MGVKGFPFVIPFDQVKVLAPLAVKVTAFPKQTAELLALAVIVGKLLMVMLAVLVVKQPFLDAVNE